MAPLSPDRMEKPFATQGDTNGSGGPGQAESSANRRKDPYLTRHIPSKGEEDTNTPKTTPAPLTKPPTYGAKVNEEKSAVAASGPSRVNTLSGGSKQANTNGVRSRDAVPLPPARKSLSSGSAASATPPVKASTTTKPTAASNTMTKGTPKGLSSKAVVGRVTVSAATLERGEAEKSPSLSDLDEEATPLTMVDGRPYTHFIGQ